LILSVLATEVPPYFWTISIYLEAHALVSHYFRSSYLPNI